MYLLKSNSSAEQLTHAFPHPRIEYRAQPADQVRLQRGSAALFCAATAAHWFDFERFFREVRRVLGPGGIVALWGYHLPVIDPAIDAQITRYTYEVLGMCWPERIRYVMDRYHSLPFPFTELQTPPFEMTEDWELRQMLGFLNSWSAVRIYEEEHDHHPIQQVWKELSEAWGDPREKRQIRWPLYMRLGAA
jgi:SAM-dependent methyltransferase